MPPEYATALATLLGTLIGGGISFVASWLMLREQNKTEFMAERTARHYLKHKGYTDRSFEVLKRHLGGFSDDDLRKILVRAGAIRNFREDGSEWWRLLERMDEYVENKKERQTNIS